MLNQNSIHAKALKLLMKYNVLAEGYVARGHQLDDRKKAYVAKNCMSSEDMACMKERGLAFDCVSMSHDEAIIKCFEYCNK